MIHRISVVKQAVEYIGTCVPHRSRFGVRAISDQELFHCKKNSINLKVASRVVHFRLRYIVRVG